MLCLEEALQVILGIYIFIYLKQSLYKPGRVCAVAEGYRQEVETSRFQDNRHMKVVRLSALATGRLYTPAIILHTHFS